MEGCFKICDTDLYVKMFNLNMFPSSRQHIEEIIDDCTIVFRSFFSINSVLKI